MSVSINLLNKQLAVWNRRRLHYEKKHREEPENGRWECYALAFAQAESELRHIVHEAQEPDQRAKAA